MIKRLFYRLFKFYRETDIRFVTYAEGDKMIRSNEGKPEEDHWVLSKKEDGNRYAGMVYLCRRIRIK